MTLVEKWRAVDWKGVYGNKWIITVLKRKIETDTTQHMIFAGRPGCGKTMMARIFASKYLGESLSFDSDHPHYREMNASDERGIDVIRSRKVKNFCKTKGPNGKKRVLFLDEADAMTPDAQRALRAIMSNNQSKVIIILSLNHLEMIKEDALLSRCMVFKFDPQPPKELENYMLDVAYGEGLTFEPEQVNDIVRDIVNHPEYKGDFRRVINDTLQKLVGIKHPITKDDIPWIYNESYKLLIDKILVTPDKAFTIFWSEYRKRYIGSTLFIRGLFERYRLLNESMSFELANIFGMVEMNIKNGGDELVQLSYLLTAIEAEI